jgi:uncharacterized protein (DUF488 family)
MDLYTIGFTKKNALKFFGSLRASGASAILDTRLNNVSQLAGFTKRDDLAYFAQEILGIPYRHELLLAPTAEMLDAYKKGRSSWAHYEAAYLDLIRGRRVEEVLDPGDLAGAVLLCSEATPERCHRRLAASYLAAAWGGIRIVHL